MTAEQQSHAETAALDDLGALSGYSEADQYLATRFRQGGRDVYCIDLSVSQLVVTLPKPDPSRPIDDRGIDLKQAGGFASQVRENRQWGSAPLLLRTPADTFAFEPLKRMAGTEWGTLTVPRLARNDLRIVAGQERLLGFHLAFEELTREIDAARGQRAATGQDDRAAGRLAELLAERQRLADERVAVQVVVVDTDDSYEPSLDSGDGAPGFGHSLLSRLLQRKSTTTPLQMGTLTQTLARDKREAERERDAARENANDLQQKLADAELERKRLDAELKAVRGQFQLLATATAPLPTAEGETEALVIASVADAVKAASALPGLRFLDNATRTAAESPYEKPEEAYAAFVALSNLAPIHDKIGMSIEDWLKSVGVNYAPHLGEGSQIAWRRKKFMFDIDGVPMLMREHLKFGNSTEPRHCLRVYMKWHMGKWVIGHVGKHL